MLSMAKYNPFEALSAISPADDPFEDLFRGFFVRPMTLESRGWGRGAPLRVDVTEDDKAYYMRAETPGARKEDINVTINGGEVTISAEVKREKDAGESGRSLWSECWYGKLRRTFRFEHDIDEAGAQARYSDGVLELTLPKLEAAAGKRITVH
jgi:HSP20 family protein